MSDIAKPCLSAFEREIGKAVAKQAPGRIAERKKMCQMKKYLANPGGKRKFIEPYVALWRVSLLSLAAAVLFCACGNKDAEQDARITLLAYPAVEGKAGNKDCKDFRGRCMVFQADKPLFRLSGFKFRALPSISDAGHDRIVLLLNTKQAEEMETIPEKHIGEGKRLALVCQGNILVAPELKARVKTKVLTIDFCNAHAYRIVLSCLRREIPHGYRFSEDKAWNRTDPVSE